MSKAKPMTTVYDATVTPAHGAKLLRALAKQFGSGATVTSYLMHRDGALLERAAKGRKQGKGHRMRIVVQVPA